MATTGHTYNSSCLLHAESNTFTRRASQASIDPPPIKAHYFYCSVLPIDDPLSPVPPPPSGTATKQKLPPRPFSVHDNAALEQTWLSLQDPGRHRGSNLDPSHHPSEVGKSKTPTSTVDPSQNEQQQDTGAELTSYEQPRVTITNGSTPAGALEQSAPRGKSSQRQEKVKKSTKSAKNSKKDTNAIKDTAKQMEPTTAPADPEMLQQLGEVTQADLTLSDDHDHIPFDETMPVGSDEIGNDEFEGNLRPRGRKPFRHGHKKEKEKPKAKDESTAQDEPEPRDGASPYRRLSMKTQKAHDAKDKADNSRLGSSPAERDTTGTPFLRIQSRLKRSLSRSPKRSHSPNPLPDNAHPDDGEQDTDLTASHPEVQQSPSTEQDPHYPDDQQQLNPPAEKRSEEHQKQTNHEGAEGHSDHEPKKSPESHVTVGASRLHVVEMPSLKMGPIYWDPVHDISSVARGTWFYKETMWPVEADVANQIEEGYAYIKPWTLTYVDELNSCQEIGPEAELKLVNGLWPAEEPPDAGPKTAADRVRKELLSTASEHLDYQNQDRKNAIAMAGSASNRAAGALDGYDDPIRLFNKCSMIYINARDAQILRPNQLPSVVRGRRPLAAMRKGRPIGVPVVRGFDFKAWESLYPPPKVPSARTAQKGLQVDQEGRTMTNWSRQDPPCAACHSAEQRPNPTDLVLVIHGIGQKLSERVESFNFTHSINAFRRSVNMELEAAAVHPWLRQGLGGIMVLPINWRSKIALEDGKPASDPNRKNTEDSTKNDFTLRDITEDSIPVVRNLISDVLLDIPYYLSHHKPKMIEAVIKEANRVYRLWCINNPGFHEAGRVHIIAHSLGSVMTLDILSKQPTKAPKQLDLKYFNVRSDIFEFDTTNLFFAGSPAGLFLYINRAALLPRRGREKPDAGGEDIRPGITGEVNTYGCLAVDNLYNIIHYIDPIAYRLNAAVDVNYAASLHVAELPSTAGTWAQYFGWKGTPSTPAAPTKALTGLENFPARPSVPTMPSTVELETHNFSREEVAEKRMFLLNDNGQIDYTLRSGGGPLEIQYLNMLSAHSSYWTTPEFVRFLVVEVGRKPGKGGTVASMKAVKKARNKK